MRGQYGPGVDRRQAVPGYREEQGVAPDSTHRDLRRRSRLYIDNWRWAGVPFYLRTGKRLPKRATEIAIQFKPAPHLLFRRDEAGDRPSPTCWRSASSPTRGSRCASTPRCRARPMRIAAGEHGLPLRRRRSAASPPEAYERLLLDAMLGDATLFTREDEVETSWALMDKILDGWRQHPRVYPYESGSWGPSEADDLLARDDRSWRKL